MKGFTRKKIFMSGVLLLALSSCAYGAAINLNPAGINNNGQVIQQGGVYPQTMGYPQGYGYGYGYNDTVNRTGNTNQQQNIQPPIYYDYSNMPEDKELTEDEINELFDQILNSQNNIMPDASDPDYDPAAIAEQEKQSQANQQGLNSSNKNITLSMDIEEYMKRKALKDEIANEERQRKVFHSPVIQLFNRIPRYGMSFFRGSPATFAPMDSAPVAQDYRINVGDEMTISIWGIPEEGNFAFTINRDGMASLPRIGSVRLAGYTFGEAERILRSRLNQYYAGYQMSLSMGKLSSILVYVTGNAKRPGAYTISSFSTLVNALIASGGPSNNGTLRKIELRRHGQLIAVFDMYAMLMRGDKTQDVRLQAGDVIHIPAVGALVGIAGEVIKPGIYELNGATRIQDLLTIVGGMNARTFSGRLQFFRIFRSAYASVLEGTLDKLENRELHDGDILRLYPVYNLTSTIDITGSLMRPGKYAIVPGQTRISDIIEHAGGLSPTASDQAEITRVTPTLEGPVNERFNINIAQALMGDPEHNITLENNDQITVLVIPDWKKQIRVTITGEVRRPGNYSMFAGERLSDLITKAGGFTQKAFLRGAVFTRKSVAAEQKQALNRMADQMERDLLQSMQNTASTAAAGEANAMNAEYMRRTELINNLRELDIMGRVVTKIDTAKNILDTEWDYELQDGDALRIPATPLTVNVMGAVYSSSTHVYRSNMGINAYISSAGGALKNAHKRMVYLLKSDGTALKLTRSTSMLTSKAWKAPRGFSPKIEPGDTIVVPVKYLDRTNIESLKDTIDIIYKVAVAAGVILDNSND